MNQYSNDVTVPKKNSLSKFSLHTITVHPGYFLNPQITLELRNNFDDVLKK